MIFVIAAAVIVLVVFIYGLWIILEPWLKRDPWLALEPSWFKRKRRHRKLHQAFSKAADGFKNLHAPIMRTTVVFEKLTVVEAWHWPLRKREDVPYLVMTETGAEAPEGWAFGDNLYLVKLVPYRVTLEREKFTPRLLEPPEFLYER